MKKFSFRLLLAGVGMACAMSVSAQYDLNAAAEEYGQEVKASIVKMEGAGKQNQGPEPFKQFIEKFSTDSAFMASRITLPAAQAEKYAHLLKPSTFEAKMPVIMDNEGADDIYYQLWDEMQFHTVHLDCLWDGIIAYVIIFDRKNGKWSLAEIHE